MTKANVPKLVGKRKDTYVTQYYKGEYIHMHYEDGLEIIQALGRYWASLKAAKRAISMKEKS